MFWKSTGRWEIYGEIMRSLISLISDGDAVMPINYQHALSSALYGFIRDANPDLSSSLHHSQDFKFFNFSNLKIPRPALKGSEIQLRNGTHVLFNFSSPAGDILEATVTGMLSGGKMRLLDADFTIEKIEIMETPDFSPLARFRTLSPIYIDMAKDGGKRWDLLPTDPQWERRIIENSRKKYAHYFGKDYRGEIEIGAVKWFKSKRMEIGREWWRAANAEFALKAEPEMLRFLWDAGIGRKNSQGFGCLQYLG